MAMRVFLITAATLLAACGPPHAQPQNRAQATVPAIDAAPAGPLANPLASAANDRLFALVSYIPDYVSIPYPGGDVPANTGVCSDVIIRSLRAAYGFDLQKAVHEDMKADFSAYPSKRIWGLSRTDRNIDHRRVPNLETYFTRAGSALPLSKNKTDFQPGDIVSWRLGGRLPHIGIVSAHKAADGTPLIIHNIGAGPKEDNILFKYTMTGHFRFEPDG